MFLLLKIGGSVGLRRSGFVPATICTRTSVQIATEEPQPNTIHPNRLNVQKFLKLPNHKVDDFFKKFHKLDTISQASLKASMRFLKRFSSGYVEIRQHPELLLHSASQLENYYMRLKECGYRQPTAYRLKNHNRIMAQSVYFNKCYNFLPHELNVAENIALSAGIEFTNDETLEYNERMPMKEVHLGVTEIYLRQRLNLTHNDVSRLMSENPSLRERSITNMKLVIDMLEHELGFSIDEISQSQLLMGYSSTTRQLIEMKELCGVDVRTIISNTPQILKVAIEDIIDIANLLLRYRIPIYSVSCYKQIFITHPATLRDNLNELRNLDAPFNVFDHPAILVLAENFQFIKRYVYVKHNQTGTAQYKLIRFIVFVLYRWKPQYILESMIAYLFDRSKSEVIAAMANVPEWKTAASHEVLCTYKYLRLKGFNMNDVLDHISVLFYPREKINGCMMHLRESPSYSEMGIDVNQLTKSQILRLYVYLLENDSQFSEANFGTHSLTENFTDDEVIEMVEIFEILP